MEEEEHYIVADGVGGEEGDAETSAIIVTLDTAGTASIEDANTESMGSSNTMLPLEFVLHGEQQQEAHSGTDGGESTDANIRQVEFVHETEGTADTQYSLQNSDDVCDLADKDIPVESLLSAVPVPHQSILKSANEIPVLDVSEDVYHCALCPESYTAWPSKDEAVEHFKNAHWAARIEIDDGVNAALCCCSSSPDVPHYHCPYCGITHQDMTETSEHVAACIQTIVSNNLPDPQDDASPVLQVAAKPDSNPQQKTYHPSIVHALSDLELEACSRKCCKGARVHCPLCPVTLCKPLPATKMHQHIQTNHWKPRVSFQELFIVKCTSSCLGLVNGRPVSSHWHCPLCDRLSTTRQSITAHLESHRRGRVHRHRSNAEWASLLDDEDAEKVFHIMKGQHGGENMADGAAQYLLDGGKHLTSQQTDNTQNEPKQVFQTVAALLTGEMLAAIPGSTSVFFSHLQEMSNFQYSSSDQWCLLQADWGTMSGVHKLLSGLLARAAKAEEEEVVDMTEQDMEGDVGGGGDASSDKEIKGNSGQSAVTLQTGADQGLSASALESSQPFTESENNDNDASGQKEAYVEQPAAFKDKLQDLIPSQSKQTRQIDKEENNSAVENISEISAKPIPATKESEYLTSEKAESSQHTDTNALPMSASVSPTPPIKRGRGRPRKVPKPEVLIEYVKPTDKPTSFKNEDSDRSGSKRRRSKLPQRYQDYDTEIEEGQEESVSLRSAQAYKPQTEKKETGKRGRGRPRKYPQVAQPEKQVDNTEAVLDEVIAKTVNTISVKMEGTGDDEETPLRKRQKLGPGEDPTITIAIDETTGNILSMAVGSEEGEGNMSEIKQEAETPKAKAVCNEIDIDTARGFELVRPKKLVMCEACERAFPDYHRYYQHVLGSTCIEKRRKRDKYFRLSPELDKVLKEAHKEVTEPKCPLCSREFKFLLHAKMHFAEKTCVKKTKETRESREKNPESGLYHCRQCSFSAEVLQRVLIHERRRHWKKTEQCPLCSKTYSCQMFLREHIKAVHCKGKERAVCEQCGVSVSARLLRQHIKIKHDPSYVKPKPKPITTPIQCPECDDFETMSYAKFMRHRSAVHRVHDKNCPHCDAKFSMSGDLNRHVRAVHEGQNQVSGECPMCGKTMAKKNIAAHVKMVHEKQRPWSCDVCGRAFLTKHTLNMHMSTHKVPEEKDTKFLCAFCGKGFSHRTHYSDHLNTHTGARPYVCTICNKTFRCNPALHKHKELHRTVNLYCGTCNMHFPNRKALRIHNNKQHSTSLFRCVCDAEYTSQETLTQHQGVCGQWQQVNPQDKRQMTLNADLQNQMAMILQQQSDGDQAAAGGTYIVLEGKDGEETVMVLQHVNHADGSGVVQAVTGSDIITVANPEGRTENNKGVDATDVMAIAEGSADKAMTNTEVLANLTTEDALTMAASEAEHMSVVTMDTDDPALLALQEDINVQQQVVVPLLDTADPESVTDMNRYLCGYCQKLFSSLEDVQTHMVAEHVVAETGEVELALHTPADITEPLQGEPTEHGLAS